MTEHQITYRPIADRHQAVCTCGWHSRPYVHGPVVTLAALEHRQLEGVRVRAG